MNTKLTEVTVGMLLKGLGIVIGSVIGIWLLWVLVISPLIGWLIMNKMFTGKWSG